jgi:hypothetical protein
VVQAGNVKSDFHPRRDSECRLSTVNVVHRQGRILSGDFRDVRHLITTTYGLLRIGTHSIKRTGGLSTGCKHDVVVTDVTYTHNSLRVSLKTLPKNKDPYSGGNLGGLTLMIA